MSQTDHEDRSAQTEAVDPLRRLAEGRAFIVPQVYSPQDLSTCS
jgi:hypothetical protein